MGRRRSVDSRSKRLAKARLEILWEQATRIARKDPSGAKRQIQIARRVAQKARLKIPPHMRRRLCKQCDAVLIPGENCRVRMRHNRSRHLTVTCLDCGAVRRFYV
ncbi:MAG: ribonuclease P protein component 4 [Candidatus Hodarchaeota archaeon]